MANRTLRIVLGDRPIAYHPILAHVFESACAALFLSQLLYWDSTMPDSKHEGRDGWIYKTGKEWLAETGLCRREQEDAREKLRASGVVEEKRAGVPCRLWYRVRFDELERMIELYIAHSTPTSLEPVCKLVGDQSTNRLDTSAQTITENTTETNTENNRDASLSLFWNDVCVEFAMHAKGYARCRLWAEPVSRANGTLTIRARQAYIWNVKRVKPSLERIARRLSGCPELELHIVEEGA